MKNGKLHFILLMPLLFVSSKSKPFSTEKNPSPLRLFFLLLLSSSYHHPLTSHSIGRGVRQVSVFNFFPLLLLRNDAKISIKAFKRWFLWKVINEWKKQFSIFRFQLSKKSQSCLWNRKVSFHCSGPRRRLVLAHFWFLLDDFECFYNLTSEEDLREISWKNCENLIIL